jgi:NIMA-interacting peptidyl-prolyl cis-trans isomerase 1
MRSSFALERIAIAVALAALPAIAACSGTQTSASANTSADSAHLATQANEPRTGDATASQAAGAVPTNRPTVALGGTTSGPASTGTTGASGTPDPTGSATPPRAAANQEDPKRIGARHVLVQWMGSDRAGKSVLRTKDQALVLVQEVLKRARAGEDLGRLAVEYSDEPNAGARGGSLGRFGKGQMVGAFEAVAFKLRVGELSDIVETPFGYHIIQRTE